ncbi:MAG TPA: hypothetical protein VLB11_04580 [Methyloceanibacter sp.]|nr:hypothetical protein [Methyloceanibacter sp.]
MFDEATRSEIDEPSSIFHKECELAALRVSDTITDPQTRREILDSLLAAATLGLGGPSPNLNEGKQYFEFFKAHVVRVAEDRRSPLIRELLYKSTYIMIASLLAIEIWAFATGGGARDAATVMLAQSSASYAAVLNGVINILGILGFALLGAVAGNLFFTLVRGRNVTFDNFDRLNPYRFSVNIHLTYLVLLVLVVLLTLYFNVITIGIGDLVLNKFTESAPLAIVIGLVCALAEATLVTLIQGRVQSIAPPTTK